ncbi:MAG: hypothetical protein ACOX5Z_00145 [Desulfobulbus sp.]|jgi:hypothetical protein
MTAEPTTAETIEHPDLPAEPIATPDPPEPDDIFPHRLAAWGYLRDSGWQISRAQFYEHCAQGRLRRQKDGTYRIRDVDLYAKTHCKRLDTGEKVNDTLARMAEDKAKTELSREKVRLEREEFDLAVKKREYVRRDEVELMIVGRAVAMLSHLQAMVQMQAEDWIVLVGGDPLRARELIAAVCQGIEGHMATFAREVEFEVILEKNIETAPEDGA